MEFLLLIIRIFLFGIFALAGIGKLLDLEGSEKAVKDFGVPDTFAKPLAIGLPLAELAIAILFLFNPTAWIAAVGGSILLLLFIGGMIRQISLGKAPDCHCFGQIHSEPVGKKSLFRNIGFAVLALFMTAQGRDGQGISLADDQFNMQTIMILVVLAILVAALFYLKRILDQQSKITRRLELLELLFQDGREVTRAEAGDPHTGLPIGSLFPTFELPDTNGKQVSLARLLEPGKPLLVLFVSPTCKPCQALLPDIEKWQQELGDRLNFVFISSGKAKENIEKFNGENKQILLQKKREVAESIQAKWTPTAVLVLPDGRIGSSVAAGDDAVNELAEKIKSTDLSKPFAYVSNDRNGHRQLKIGENIPEIALMDMQGREVTNEGLLGKETLAVLWSPTCPHCLDMMDEISEWEKIKKEDDPRLVLFSVGTRAEHEKFGLRSHVILEENLIPRDLGMRGTPSGVLINKDGRIVSETAIGAANIWSLIRN